jgi:hypothetical protein
MANPSNNNNPKSIIRAEDQILFLCARQNFLENHHQRVAAISRRGKINWDDLFFAACRHGIAPLVAVNLNKFDDQDIEIPGETAEKFRLTMVDSIAMAGKRTDQLAKIYSLFENLSIDIMAIKGAAHDILVYDQPWYTTANDTDLIIKLDPSEFRQSDKWHLEDLKQDISLEYDFMGHHDVTINGILPIDFDRIWKDARGIQYRDQKLFVMSPEDMLITSCINSCRKRYFRLKALFDIAEVIDKFPDLDWPEFVRKAKDYQCNYIVYTGLMVTKEMLGCSIPKGVFSDLDVNRNRAQIIQGLISRISSYPLIDLSIEYGESNPKPSFSLILPYASYRWDQVVRKIGYIWTTR